MPHRLIFLLIASLCFTHQSVAAGKNFKIKPATEKEEQIYRGMATSFLCNALRADLEYEKVLEASVYSHAQLLDQVHGGMVKSVSKELKKLGKERLDRKTLLRASANQIILTAYNACPDEMPQKVKDDIKKDLEMRKIDLGNKKN